MMIRAGTGWQYALADLSLILFLVTASALSMSGKAAPVPAPPQQPIAAALESAPVAVWSAADGAPPLAEWLGQVGSDPRLEVRVVVRYSDGEREAAVAQALQLAVAGGARASRARVLIEPGERAGASVSLFYASEAPVKSAAPLAR
ncbi:MAG: hypothetical protein ACOVQ0_18735 [Novosphingobium sp.]|uniref:hypothetical protein n=1 Tax=Novosphingobium sp. TaxID=1874826 RepID=UPI003B9BD62B